MKRMRNLKGFTLIELIVVILILGILAAIAVVGYTSITDKANMTTLQANAKQVGTDLSAKATLDEVKVHTIVDTTTIDDYDLGDDYSFTEDVTTPGSETLTIANDGHSVVIDISGDVAVVGTVDVP